MEIEREGERERSEKKVIEIEAKRNWYRRSGRR